MGSVVTQVGEKSNSIRFLSNKMPAWIKFPASVVIPFGVFEKVLSEDINKVCHFFVHEKFCVFFHPWPFLRVKLSI